MDVSAIISSIDAELSRLQQARSLLAGPVPIKRRGLPKNSETKPAPPKPAKKVAKKRTMSPEGRARVAAAQQARWAAVKSGTKK